MVQRYRFYFHDWYENDRERFYKVSESLAASINMGIDYREIDGEKQLCLLEGYKTPLPFR